MKRRVLLASTMLVPAICLLVAPASAQACSLDSRPSAYADGQLDRANVRPPTTRAQLARWSPFFFAHTYALYHAVMFTENRRDVARSLVAPAMRRPWRWRFGDGRVAYGWTVRHAYTRAGHWRILVDAYYPATRQWYNFDQVAITVGGRAS